MNITGSIRDYQTTGGIASNATTGTLQAIQTGSGLTGGPIYGTGTISIAPTGVTPNSYTNANITVNAAGQIVAASNGSGSGGTVTNIATTADLTGGPITTTGTLGLSNTGVSPNSYTNANIVVDAKGRITSAGNGTAGTVTSVATGTGLTGGPITSTGTVSLANTAVTPNSYLNANITVDAQGRLTAASNGLTPQQPGFTTTVSSGAAINLLVSSTYIQQITGSTAQTINLPSTATLTAGWTVVIYNNSTALITVNTSTAALVGYVSPSNYELFVCNSTASNAATSWSLSDGAGPAVLGIQCRATGTTSAALGTTQNAGAFTGCILTGYDQTAAANSQVIYGYQNTPGNATPAFIAGYSNSNASASGGTACVVGVQNTVTNVYPTCFGLGNTLGGTYQSTAVGYNNNVSAGYATAVGTTVALSNNGVVGVGANLTASGAGLYYCGAVGANITCTGQSTWGIGSSLSLTGVNSVALGVNSSDGGFNGAVMLGAGLTIPDASHTLGLSVNTSTLTPGSVGAIVNTTVGYFPFYVSPFTTTAKVAGTTTLLVTTVAKVNEFTGAAAAQTVKLPATNTLSLGYEFRVVNRDATTVLTMQTNNATALTNIDASSSMLYICRSVAGAGAITEWLQVGPTEII